MQEVWRGCAREDWRGVCEGAVGRGCIHAKTLHESGRARESTQDCKAGIGSTGQVNEGVREALCG